MVTLSDIVLFFLPMVTGYVSSYLCPIGSNAGIVVNARPPSCVFMIIWPILYILLGLSWVNANNNHKNNKLIVNILYGLLTLCLSSWTYFYGCESNKLLALYTLPVSILLILIILLYNPTFLLLPLLVWLFFAMMINFEEVNRMAFENFNIIVAPTIRI